MKTDKSKYLDVVVIILTISAFVAIKLNGLSWRFGDGNAYFYMANQILTGQLPYQDFLLADPPLLVFILAVGKALIGNKLILFQWLPIILEVTTASLLFIISKPKLPKLARFIPAIYLFSFLILATSDYVTGLHFVNLLLVLAFLYRDKSILSGIFWGLATLIKLYVVPGFIGWLMWLLIKNDKEKRRIIIKTILSYITTGLIAMLPFLIIVPNEVINYLLLHQLARPPGISKLKIFSFFFVHDFTLIVTTLAAVSISLKTKKKTGPLLPILLWSIFFLIFPDLYYLYLAVMAPWLILAVAELLAAINSSSFLFVKQHSHQLSIMLITSILLAQMIGVFIYRNNIQKQGIFTQLPQVTNYITNLEKKPLYGSHEVAPLVALKTNSQLFANHIDTNAQLFGSGVINKQQISRQAAEQGVYLLVKVANNPENTNLDQGYEKYFAQDVFQQACRRLEIFNGNDAEVFDDVAIYDCQL